MKTIFCFFIFFSVVSFNTDAQLNLKDKVKQKTNQRINQRTNQGIDKGLDKVEDGIGDAFKKDKKEDSDKKTEQQSTSQQQTESRQEQSQASGTSVEQNEDKKPELTWSKYDFVPGDKVIFEDNQENEENGEFPSRWDLVRGNVENAKFGEDNVIMFRGGDPHIVPYLKNSDVDYLPDVFTVEFDLYLPGSVKFTIHFFDRKNQKTSSGYSSLGIWSTQMELYPASSKIPDGKSIAKKWAHIAIAYTNGKMKAYIDDTRLINIPHLSFNPMGITLESYHASDQNRYYIKNFRLAEGGVKYYDRVLQDGKIVSNGIRFDIGKATLKPESMGVINEIYDLMEDHPEIKFSIEGHTDNDGDDASNQKLSKERARTVMNTLINMGISKERLTSKGFGESKPIDNNGTAEGKANNRRVEFVKM